MKPFSILVAVAVIIAFQPAFSQKQNINGAKLNANNISTWVNANGSLFWDMVDHRYWVPANTHSSTIYTSSLWAGAKDQSGDLHLAQIRYFEGDFSPGPLLDNGIAKEPERWNKVWKVTRKEVLNHVEDYSSDGKIDGPVASSILQWPAKGNEQAIGNNGESLDIKQDLAPFVDVNNNGKYDPKRGDYPDIKGDQMLWWVYNDQNKPHISGGDRLRMEFRTSVYSYDKPEDSVLNNTVFVSYEIKYKGSSPLNDLFLASWTDFDIGCASNDNYGSNPATNSYYAYNAMDKDTCQDQMFMNNAAYGDNPPMQIVSILNSPMSGAKMSYFTFHAGLDGFGFFNDANPWRYYRVMNGDAIQDLALKWGGDTSQGEIKHMFPDDPNDKSPGAWSQCRESLMPNMFHAATAGMGPIPKVNTGDVFQVDLAYITHFPKDQQGCRVDFPESSVKDVQEFFKQNTHPVGIDSDRPRENIEIYPNPADDQIHIQIGRSGDESTLTLVDVRGKVLAERTLRGNSASIDVSGFSSGIYFVQLKQDDQVTNHKVVVE